MNEKTTKKNLQISPNAVIEKPVGKLAKASWINKTEFKTKLEALVKQADKDSNKHTQLSKGYNNGLLDAYNIIKEMPFHKGVLRDKDPDKHTNN